jgi:hypothetical protein
MQDGTKHALEFGGALTLSAVVAYLLWPRPPGPGGPVENLFWIANYPPESTESDYVTVAIGGGIPGNPVSLFACEPSYDCPATQPCGDVAATSVFDNSGYVVFDWPGPGPSEGYYLWVIDTATGNWIGSNGGKGAGCFSGSDCCPVQ